MKQLFWKEWYELRWLPLMAAVCVAMLIFGAKVFGAASDPAHRFTFGDTFLPLAGTWMICALLAGAGLFAQEVGSGGLQFLSALPTSRRRIWCVKVTMALGILLLAVICGALAWAVIDVLMFRTDFFAFWTTLFSSHGAFFHTREVMEDASELLWSLIGFFAVALAVSPFLDRSISTVVAALLVGLAYFGILQSLYNYIDYYGHYGRLGDWEQHSRDGLLLILVCLSLLIFVTISYWTFTRGGTLRSAKRFWVGALSGATSLGVAMLVFGVGFYRYWW